MLQSVHGLGTVATVLGKGTYLPFKSQIGFTSAAALHCTTVSFAASWKGEADCCLYWRKQGTGKNPAQDGIKVYLLTQVFTNITYYLWRRFPLLRSFSLLTAFDRRGSVCLEEEADNNFPESSGAFWPTVREDVERNNGEALGLAGLEAGVFGSGAFFSVSLRGRPYSEVVLVILEGVVVSVSSFLFLLLFVAAVVATFPLDWRSRDCLFEGVVGGLVVVVVVVVAEGVEDGWPEGEACGAPPSGFEEGSASKMDFMPEKAC